MIGVETRQKLSGPDDSLTKQRSQTGAVDEDDLQNHCQTETGRCRLAKSALAQHKEYNLEGQMAA